jgi:hypothetical protein
MFGATFLSWARISPRYFHVNMCEDSNLAYRWNGGGGGEKGAARLCPRTTSSQQGEIDGKHLFVGSGCGAGEGVERELPIYALVHSSPPTPVVIELPLFSHTIQPRAS